MTTNVFFVNNIITFFGYFYSTWSSRFMFTTWYGTNYW